MLVFSGKSTLELRRVDQLKKEGLKLEMEDAVVAMTASLDGTKLLANVSLTNPRIELLSFAAHSNWGTTIQKYKGHHQTNFILRPQFGGY